jgi:hypothetical protein
MDLDEIYIFLVLSFFYLRTLRCSKNNINFQEHNYHALLIVVLEKQYLFCMVSNEDTFDIKVIALNEIYNFMVLSFYIWGR